MSFSYFEKINITYYLWYDSWMVSAYMLDLNIWLFSVGVLGHFFGVPFWLDVDSLHVDFWYFREFSLLLSWNLNNEFNMFCCMKKSLFPVMLICNHLCFNAVSVTVTYDASNAWRRVESALQQPVKCISLKILPGALNINYIEVHHRCIVLNH